jgi:type IV secretory pathway VirB10-like protein
MNTTSVKEPTDLTSVTGYCGNRAHKRCPYHEGGKAANGIALSDGGFYMCPCHCHEHQAEAVRDRRLEVSLQRRKEVTDYFDATTEQVVQPGSILETTPPTPEPVEVPESPEVSPQPVQEPKPQDEPTQRERRVQKGEHGIRLGKPFVAWLRKAKVDRDAKPIIKKLASAHVYKDGAVVLSLTEDEADTLRHIAFQEDSRSARAVVDAIDKLFADTPVSVAS